MCPGVMTDVHDYRDAGRGGSAVASGVNGIHPSVKKAAGSEEKRPTEEELAIIAPPLPHLTVGFYSLGKLVQRMAQDTHNRLNDVLDSASEGTDPTRKLKLINFFMERRQQFIKLLVLTLYAKKSGDLSKIIDMKLWFDQMLWTQFDEVCRQLWTLRTDFVNARIPNPDLKTALEVFTNGATSNTKTYGFVPPPKLQPEEVLRQFRKIDTILAFRFAIHDPPPPHFQDYKIHSGRAIFRVEHEFEAAFSIAQEDHTSQLYIVDFKLAFKPVEGERLPESVWRSIERHGNVLLSEKKLPGIYDFLHEYTLSHKVTILSQQAKKMLAGRWIDSLQITPIKRSIRIRYWINKPDSKSWIDVGVMAPRKEEPSRLGVRWTRDGQEVTDVTVPINVGDLSADSVVKSAIALHTKHLLTQVYQNLLALPVFSADKLTLYTSTTDSVDSYLKIMMTTNRHVTLSIEPINGRLLLRKSTLAVSSCEHTINVNPIAQTHQLLGRLRRHILTEEITSKVRSAGWEILKPSNVKPEDALKWFASPRESLTYMRRKTWKQGWCLVCVIGDAPETWWIANLQEAPIGWTITDAKALVVDTTAGFSFELINNLEKIASAFICEYINCRSLNEKSIRYTLKSVRGGGDSPTKIPNILIQTSSIAEANWAKDFLRMRFMGLDASGKANIVVEGQAKEPMTQLKMRDMSSSEADVTFHTRSGGFALKFTVSVGDSVIDEVVERLQRIKRLISFVSVIRRFKLSCRHVSLGRIVFIYTTEPIRTAEITFSGDNLQLDLPKDSPHLRIKPFLEKVLNEKGLENVIFQLLVTRTLLVALHELEESIPEPNLQIIARSPEWYRLKFMRTNPQTGASLSMLVDIKLHCRRSEYWWCIKDSFATNTQSAEPQNVNRPLRSLYMDRFKPGIEGFKNSLAANLDNVGKAVHNVAAALGFGNRRSAPSVSPQQKHLTTTSGSTVGMPSPGMQNLPTVVRQAGPSTGASQDDALTID